MLRICHSWTNIAARLYTPNNLITEFRPLSRIEEAKATGAEAIVTACSWCKRNFVDAIKESGIVFEQLPEELPLD